MSIIGATAKPYEGYGKHFRRNQRQAEGMLFAEDFQSSSPLLERGTGARRASFSERRKQSSAMRPTIKVEQRAAVGLRPTTVIMQDVETKTVLGKADRACQVNLRVRTASHCFLPKGA